MNKRTKIIMVCDTIDKTRDEFLEWWSVLEEHLGKAVKCLTADRRITTPFAIIDFAPEAPADTKGYKIILHTNQDDERLLQLAIGEETH